MRYTTYALTRSIAIAGSFTMTRRIGQPRLASSPTPGTIA
jgi:hypothetical protein